MGVHSRRDFLRLGLGGVVAGTLQVRCFGGGQPQKKRPNVLFVVTDDQRFDTITALGNTYIATPYMDQFVRRGTFFSNAYIMGSTSGAVCKPSRAMLLSGRNLFGLVKSGGVIPEQHVMLPELFRRQGYVTFATGKWHNDKSSFSRCFSTGANIFFGGMSDHYGIRVCDFDPTGKYPARARHCYEGKHSSELFSDAAVEFLRSHDGNRPFFMWVAYTAPHDPRTAPKEYRDLYRDKEMPLPANFMSEHPFDNGELKIRDERLADWPRTDVEIRRHLADYYAMITHLDAQLGRVLEALADTGRDGNTIIVLVGDNGLAIGSHGLMGKQNLYEHSIRVPLIICGPGIPRNRRVQGLCYAHDLYPTLCELAGIAVPKSVQSRSLVPVMENGTGGRETLFFAYKDLQRAVRDRRYKLIEYTVAGRRTTQLFDLQADPWELRNLAESPEHKQHLERLRGRLLQWKKRVGDPTAGA